MPVPQRPVPLARLLSATIGAGVLAATLVACAPSDTADPVSPGESSSATPGAGDETPTAAETPSDEPDAAVDAEALIATAFTTGDTATLETLLADPTRVVIAASEADGQYSPIDALISLDYVQPGVGFWDFELDQMIVDVYRGNPYYGSFFPSDAVVGRSDTGAVVAFVPAGESYATIFMSIDEGLVTSY